MESRAECCSAWPVAGGGCADRGHILVPVGCTGQPPPVRWCVSLRTLAGTARGPYRGGNLTSPGHEVVGSRPSRAGLRPIRPAGLQGGGDDGLGLHRVHHCADHHGAAGPVHDGLGLVGEAACADPLPGSLVAVALPATVTAGADGPLPARSGGPVGCFAVPERCEAVRAVLRGIPRRHCHDRNAGLGCQVPHTVGDLTAHGLGHARVLGAAHASSFHRPKVLQIDDRGPHCSGLIDCPAGSSPRQRVVEVGPALRDTPDLLRQHSVLAVQGGIGEP